jgi:hypothetical protein
MTKLTKAELTQRDAAAQTLQDRYTDLMAAIEAYNNAISAHWTPVETALADYNEAINEANAWKQDRAQEMQDYIEDKSEKWQESDKAQQLTAWKEQYEEEFEQVEIEQPEPIDDGSIEDYSQVLWELPETAAAE